MKKKEHKTIEISHQTIIFTVLFLIGLYLVFLLRDIILLVFIALLFVTAVNPLVSALEKQKIPRILSIAIVYLIVILLLILTVATVVPPLVSQLVGLISQINLPPSLIDNLVNREFGLQDLQIIANQLNSIPKVVNVATSAFAGVVIFFTILVLSFYMLQERKHLHKYLVWLFGKNGAEKKAELFVNKIEEQIGGWVRGELTLMMIVGLMTFIGLKLLQVSYALPLAIFAGLLEILPNVGPTVALIPAVAVAYFTGSPSLALAVFILYILVQQIENNLIVPMVMNKTTGINPIITILLLLVGYRLAGVGGAALAIPVFLVVKVIGYEIYKLRWLSEEALEELDELGDE